MIDAEIFFTTFIIHYQLVRTKRSAAIATTTTSARAIGKVKRKRCNENELKEGKFVQAKCMTNDEEFATIIMGVNYL